MSFFKESAAGERAAGKASKKNASKKPLYIGDLERKIITEKDGEYDEVEDEGLAAEASKGRNGRVIKFDNSSYDSTG